ncbi:MULTISPECIES: hypothetical protein [Bacillus]|uniref:hypothetical protein n=1 Tax=Bacillus TaxID=1386 RepID=UPI000BEBC693|nr:MULTISPECIES: hypothetical protein [Bacillus]KAB2372585.1 hypothetical protein F8510_25860 [Bacillus sp. RM2(2019)]PEG02528.1 hypothetical protein CON54_22825 [Bacillus cereus]PFH98181.1 hypothetical protein COI64_28145 [Bacillus cereus]PGK97805.1 hypothetical protein CN910_08875 [Bacillus cereus]
MSKQLKKKFFGFIDKINEIYLNALLYIGTIFLGFIACFLFNPKNQLIIDVLSLATFLGFCLSLADFGAILYEYNKIKKNKVVLAIGIILIILSNAVAVISVGFILVVLFMYNDSTPPLSSLINDYLLVFGSLSIALFIFSLAARNELLQNKKLPNLVGVFMIMLVSLLIALFISR